MQYLLQLPLIDTLSIDWDSLYALGAEAYLDTVGLTDPSDLDSVPEMDLQDAEDIHAEVTAYRHARRDPYAVSFPETADVSVV